MLLAVGTALFFLLHAAPGGPVIALSGEFADADTIAILEARLGLDKPLPEQYRRFVGMLAVGDLGTSYVYDRPVAGVILGRLPATLILVAPAILFAALLGVPVGIRAAQRGGASMYLIGLSLICFAMPVFWLGHLLRLGFSVELGLTPVQGMTDPRAFHQGLDYALDVARHAALPWITLILHQLAYTILITRAAMRAQTAQPYFMTALAKGASRWRAESRHALPNAAGPIIALLGARIGWLITGAVLVETVFAWPGLGLLANTAIQNRDYPLLIGIVLVATLFTLIANLIADLTHLAMDPRLRERLQPQ